MQKLLADPKNNFPKQHHFERDVISLLAARAEREAGYSPRKVGWMPWFGKILRSESALLQKLRNSVKAWPPLEREIFELYFIDQMELADIALMVGCTARTFHSHLCFIQRRLREALVHEVLTESKFLVVDNWTLRLKCRSCAIGHGQHAILAVDPL